MNFDISNKQKFIEKLNVNYRTILTYGNGEMLPVGEFIVKDIIVESPEEFGSIDSLFEAAQLVLAKIEDEKVEITMPLKNFSKYQEMAKNNADKLGLGSEIGIDIQNLDKNAQTSMILNGDISMPKDAETMPLFENDIYYYINGEEQSSNYSICPVDLGKYRERIRNRYYDNERDNGRYI